MATTPTYPKNDPYANAERIVTILTRQFIRDFRRTSLLPTDELNVLHGARELYGGIYREILTYYLRLAREVYARERGLSPASAEVKRTITEKWVEEFLLAYDPVTKSVFKNELHRREELFAEAVLATGAVIREREAALKALVRMVRQGAIKITDKATEKAYRDNNVERVMWLTRNDELRCAECGMLHGEVFDIDKVPDKPHRNCRCWVVPVV